MKKNRKIRILLIYETDKPTDTTKIMVTWPWTNIAAKLLLFRVWTSSHTCR